jgi:hypothetical protein
MVITGFTQNHLVRTIHNKSNQPEPMEGQGRPCIEEVRGVERSQRETNNEDDLSTNWYDGVTPVARDEG